MDHGKAVGSMVKRKKEGEVMTGGPTPQKKIEEPKMAPKPKRGRKRMMRKHGGKHDRSMYMGGGELYSHGGLHAANPAPSQPTYGSTVADAMPKAGPV